MLIFAAGKKHQPSFQVMLYFIPFASKATCLFSGTSNCSPNLLENTLLVKLAVFIKDGGGMLIAAMLVSYLKT
ncbi:hypothetical protein GCM10027286_04480 [Virgibacillus ainsalahensis]